MTRIWNINYYYMHCGRLDTRNMYNHTCMYDVGCDISFIEYCFVVVSCSTLVINL